MPRRYLDIELKFRLQLCRLYLHHWYQMSRIYLDGAASISALRLLIWLPYWLRYHPRARPVLVRWARRIAREP